MLRTRDWELTHACLEEYSLIELHQESSIGIVNCFDHMHRTNDPLACQWT